MPKWRRRNRKQCLPIAQGDGTSLVPLTQEKFAVIDTADELLVSGFGWFGAKQADGRYYARGKRFGKSTEVHYLHRLVLGNPSAVVDHENGDGLDCRRCNLRLADHSLNGGNIRRVRGASRFKGVTRSKSPVKPWSVKIETRGLRRHVGTFRTEVEAAMAYDAAAIEHFGEFAATNASLGLLTAVDHDDLAVHSTGRAAS